MSLRKKRILWGLLTILLLVMGSGVVSHAAWYAELDAGTTYSTKLTGSKRHTIKFNYTWDYSSYTAKSVNIYIDGKKKKEIKKSGVYFAQVYVCNVSTNRNLIYVHGDGPSADTVYIKVFEYKNGKLKELADLTKLTRGHLKGTLGYGMLKQVKTNKVIVSWYIRSKALGCMLKVDIPYKVSGNKITRSGSSYKLYNSYGSTKRWKANCSFKVYTKAGGSKKSFTVKKGDKVNILKATGKKGKTYFQIQNMKGKKGWFAEPKKYLKPISGYGTIGYFKEAMFAG